MYIAHSRVQVWVELHRNSLHAESIHMHVQLKLKLKSQRALGTLNKDWRWTNRLTPIEHRRCQPSNCLPRAPAARDVRGGRRTCRHNMPLSAQRARPPQRSPRRRARIDTE